MLKWFIGAIAIVSILAAIIFGAAFFAFVREHWKMIIAILAVIYALCHIGHLDGPDAPW